MAQRMMAMAQVMAVINVFFVIFLFQTSVCDGYSLQLEVNVTDWEVVPFTGEAGNVSYYVSYFKKVKWISAHQFCQSHSMHLAAIVTKEEEDALAEVIFQKGTKNHIFWTSGNDFPGGGEPRQFYWLSTGRRITYTNWEAGQPNNWQGEPPFVGTQHCVALNIVNGTKVGWQDRYCSEAHHFICEVRNGLCFVNEYITLSTNKKLFF